MSQKICDIKNMHTIDFPNGIRLHVMLASKAWVIKWENPQSSARPILTKIDQLKHNKDIQNTIKLQLKNQRPI